MKKLSKGLLVAIEGVDGAGKTTQVRRLSDYFRQLGYEVATFKEPTDGEYGQQIRRLAKFGREGVTPAEEFELFLKDRIEDCKLNILPALAMKKLVIMDRYYFSNIAYQGALGLDVNYILKRNEEVAPVPDIMIFLDVLPEGGLIRIKNFRKEDHNAFEKADYLDRVRQVFQKMNFKYLRKVDGSREEDAVFADLKNIVQDAILPLTLSGVGENLKDPKDRMKNSIQSGN